jgi:hypothetical protein
MNKMVATMAAIAGALIGAFAPVNAGLQETTSPWNDTYDAVSLTVTNGMAIGLIGRKLILTSTTVASGTNALTISTPFPFTGEVVIKVKTGTTNHITIATNANIRASGNIALVPGAAVATSDTVILYVTDTTKAYVIGGIVY